MKILDGAVAKLQADPSINVTIEGHTDSIGTSSTTWRSANAAPTAFVST